MIRRPRRSLAIASAIAGLLTATGLLAGPPADAAPIPAHDPGLLHRVTSTLLGSKKIRDYWTPHRMRAAIPLDARPGPGWRPSKVAKGKPIVIKAARDEPTSTHSTLQRSTTASYAGGQWTGGGRVVETTGKVFMTLNGNDYVCSGGVIPADNKSLVVTAGHCVNDGAGSFVTNFEFVPGYNNGSAPYGEWAATEVVTTSQWSQQGDHNYDVGFALMSELNGWTIQNAVGSQGIGFNQPRGQATYAFGYPASYPYNGQVLDYSYGSTGADSYGGSNDQAMTNNMTSGSSGGPWLQDFNPSTGVGVQTSVNSYSYEGQSNVMYGPYFGSAVLNTYNYVQGLSVN